MPDIQVRALDIIKKGADIEFLVQVANLDRQKFKVFKGGEALAVLEVITEHLLLRKFCGPFPPSMFG